MKVWLETESEIIFYSFHISSIVPKSWKKSILIIWKKYEKIKAFQNYGFLKYFTWSRNPSNFQNIGKVNSHSTRKLWENINVLKVWVFYKFPVKQNSIQFQKHGEGEFFHILCEELIHTTSKTWEKCILIVREKYGKTRTFQSYGFLKYFVRRKSPSNSQNMGWLDSHVTRKDNTNIPKLRGSYIFHVKQKPYNSQIMGWVNSHIKEQVWKNTDDSQVLLYLTDFELMKTHKILNFLRM